jgi:hypothetical protein
MVWHKIPVDVNLGYPVGSNIDSNYKGIIALVNQFKHFAKSDLEAFDKIDIICRGSSGAIIATIFYSELKREYPESRIWINHVKKPGESSHSTAISLESHTLKVFVDDFVSSGDTVIETWDACKKRANFFTKFHYIVVASVRQGNVNSFESHNLSDNIIAYEG